MGLWNTEHVFLSPVSDNDNTHVVDIQSCLFPGPLGTSAGLEIGSDPLPGPLRVLRELPGAGVDDGLDLLFGLLGDGNMSVQVLVHKQSDEHL